MTLRVRRFIVIVAAAALFFVPMEALAYGGPGSVISGVGALLAAVAAVAAATLGFFCFPVKRLVKKIRSKGQGDAVTDRVEG